MIRNFVANQMMLLAAVPKRITTVPFAAVLKDEFKVSDTELCFPVFSSPYRGLIFPCQFVPEYFKS